MPHIQVTLVRGRTNEQKRRIAECPTALLADRRARDARAARR